MSDALKLKPIAQEWQRFSANAVPPQMPDFLDDVVLKAIWLAGVQSGMIVMTPCGPGPENALLFTALNMEWDELFLELKSPQTPQPIQQEQTEKTEGGSAPLPLLAPVKISVLVPDL